MVNKIQLFRFTPPSRQFLIMLVILVAFAACMLLLSPSLLPIFNAAPVLNGIIFFVFIIGVVACFWQVWQVRQSVSWINAQASARPEKSPMTPRLLAPLVVLMKGGQLPSGMSTNSAQSITDSVATRLDEMREITRYLINLLIFLGLLGTFYGLATTIPGVVDTIRSLNTTVDPEGGNGFQQVMSGLETQLGGMGTALGSSLIGLTGSLLVGLLELFAGHGQNRFYREFEEWISHFTTVGMAETGLELQIDPNDDSALARAFRGLSESLGRLEMRLEAQDAKADQNREIFESFHDAMITQQNMSGDMRNALRGVETQLVRIYDEMAVGRDASTQEVRRDLATIVATLKRAVDGPNA